MRHLLLITLAVAGCAPDFGQLASLVTEPRVLAVRGEPAEVRPGQDVMFTTLVVSPDGTDAAPQLAWSLCLTPKPLDENNVVASGCLGGGDGIMPVGDPAPMQTINVPLNACGLFGPDPPPSKPGEPPLRPRDPDVSGGFYQPVRVERDKLTGFGLERITCNLASAGADIAIQFAMSYHPNTNPTLMTPLGSSTAFDAIPAGSKVTFTAAWTPESVETYPVYDVVAQNIIDHREAMRVSWFATAGSFEHEVTGRTEDETETSSDNVWTAPAQAGVVHLWLVLRDSRGGIAFAGQDLGVQ
jgi:hypothetical protein